MVGWYILDIVGEDEFFLVTGNSCKIMHLMSGRGKDQLTFNL